MGKQKLEITADYKSSKEVVLDFVISGLHEKEDAIRRSLLVSNFTVRIPLFPLIFDGDVEGNCKVILCLCRGIELEKERRLFKTLESIAGRPVKNPELYLQSSSYDDDPENTFYVGITYVS